MLAFLLSLRHQTVISEEGLEPDRCGYLLQCTYLPGVDPAGISDLVAKCLNNIDSSTVGIY